MRKISLRELIGIIIGAVIQSLITACGYYYIFHEQNWKRLGIIAFFTGLIVMYIVVIVLQDMKKRNAK